MSKILNKGDIGFGIMFEQDAGYITPELNKHLIGENYKYSIDPSGKILINCILQKYGVKNRNGRVYPEDILKHQVALYQQLIDESCAGGSSDHPDSSNISLNEGGGMSHVIRKMWWGNGENSHILYGQIELIVTDGFLNSGIVSMPGDKILLYINKYSYKIGISSRGVGSIKEVNGVHIVQSDFELIGWDLVSTPSTPGAFLFPEQNSIQVQETIITSHNKINETINKKLLIIDNFLKN